MLWIFVVVLTLLVTLILALDFVTRPQVQVTLGEPSPEDIIAPESIGMGLTVFVSIETGDHSSAWLSKFAQLVTAMPEVMEFHRMAGDIDYMLRVAVPDMQAYDAFYKKLIDTMPLKNVTSRFSMERIKSTTAYPISAEPRAARDSRKKA